MDTYAVPAPRPVLTQTTERFHHVQVRPEELFTEFRTPLAGDTTLSTLDSGCDVREGRIGPDEWVVESVLIPVEAVEDGKSTTRCTWQIVDHLES
jgi:hypothetical protein